MFVLRSGELEWGVNLLLESISVLVVSMLLFVWFLNYVWVVLLLIVFELKLLFVL